MSIEFAGSSLSFTKTTFPGGESCIRLQTESFDPIVTIELDFVFVNGKLVREETFAGIIERLKQ